MTNIIIMVTIIGAPLVVLALKEKKWGGGYDEHPGTH